MRTTRLNVPTTADDKVRHFWRAFLEGVGFTAAQIDGAGDIAINRAMFVGKECFVHYVEGDKDAGVWDQTNVIGPTAWKVAKAADKAAGAVLAQGGVAAAGQSLGTALGGGLGQTTSVPAISTPVDGAAQTPQGLLASLGAPSA